MIKIDKIGKIAVYLAEFGTGDIAVVPAAPAQQKGRPAALDNMIWLVQDEPKPEDEWDNDPLVNVKNTDELNGNPLPIVLMFNSAKSATILAEAIAQIALNIQAADELRIKRLKALLEVKEISESGFAGTLPSGEIVDRRDYPQAMPIKANPMFNIPEPLPLPKPAERGAIL